MIPLKKGCIGLRLLSLLPVLPPAVHPRTNRRNQEAEEYCRPCASYIKSIDPLVRHAYNNGVDDE